MAISYVATQTATEASATTVTVAKPTGVASQDVLVALLASNNQVVTAPEGWTAAADEVVETFRCQMFYKAAGGSEPADYAFSVGSAASLVAIVSAWRGCDVDSPFDIAPSMSASTSQVEPYSTPTVSGGTDGRLVYFRSVRATTASPAVFTEGTEGVSELADVGVFSGGTASYSAALYADDADYATPGSKPGLPITSDSVESHNVAATWGLLAARVPGDLGVVLPFLPEPDISALVEIPGDMEGALPLLAAEGGIWVGDYVGDLVATLSLQFSASGQVSASSTLDVAIPVAMSLNVETRKFSENVIQVPEDNRWLVILQDGVRPGDRRTARREGAVATVIPVGVEFQGARGPDIAIAASVAHDASVQLHPVAGFVNTSVADRTKAPSAQTVTAAATAYGATVVQRHAEHVPVLATAYNVGAITGESYLAPAGEVSGSAVVYSPVAEVSPKPSTARASATDRDRRPNAELASATASVHDAETNLKYAEHASGSAAAYSPSIEITWGAGHAVARIKDAPIVASAAPVAEVSGAAPDALAQAVMDVPEVPAAVVVEQAVARVAAEGEGSLQGVDSFILAYPATVQTTIQGVGVTASAYSVTVEVDNRAAIAELASASAVADQSAMASAGSSEAPADANQPVVQVDLPAEHVVATGVANAPSTNRSSSALVDTAAVAATANQPTVTSLEDDLLKHAESIGDGANVSYTVTHNFGSRDVIVRVYDSATFAEVGPEVVHATTNTVTVGFAVAPSTDAYRVVVLYSSI